MGDDPEKWEELLRGVEEKANEDILLASKLREKIAPSNQARRARRKSAQLGLSEDQALQGFLDEVAKVGWLAGQQCC